MPRPRSIELLAACREHEPPCMADQIPVVSGHAEDVWVYDVEGNRYLDLTSGVLVANIGHAHPHHVEAIRHQAGRLMNCYSFPTPERIQLSARLAKILPVTLDRFFLLSPSAELCRTIILEAAQYGLMMGRVGLYGNVIRVAPPLTIQKRECDLAIAVLDRVLSEL